MKTIKNAILLLCLLCMTTIHFISCKKENGTPDIQQPTITQVENAKKEIANQMRTSGIPETFPINKRINPVLLDKDWNVVEPTNMGVVNTS